VNFKVSDSNIVIGVRDTKKRSCLSGEKNTNTDLDAPLNNPGRGEN
jgi:hypothetical protein